jgi:co-chaperonin GroES (HSP10)
MSTGTVPTRVGLHALPGRILVKEDKPLEKIGRILIPEKHQSRPTMGTVVDIGVGTQTTVQIGDKIVYPRWSGTGIQIKGMAHAYRALTPEECLCLVDDGIEIEDTGA